MAQHNWESNEIEIAISRFSKGLEWVHNVENSATYAVMAIEALLLKNETDQKLRFAMKTSKLLGLIGLDMKRVYKDMEIAYAVRSSYVHGDKIKRSTQKEISKHYKNDEEFSFVIMDYARLIICIFLLLNKPKDVLFKMMNNTIFEKDDKSLRMAIKPYLKYLNTKNYKPKFRIYQVHGMEYLTE